MSGKLAALSVALAATAVLAACGGRYGSGVASNDSTFTLPGMPDLQMTATNPDGSNALVSREATGTVSEELPTEGLGTVNDPFWKATLGGYTQQQFSQALGFAPGTKLTIKNISPVNDHTLNVVKKITGPPAKFPPSPSLGMSPSGGKLQKGYRSGIIKWGSSVKVTLGKAGIYLFGCAFHYHQGMQDVFVVHTGATPGPQGTKPPS
jgi:plastocyanin